MSYTAAMGTFLVKSLEKAGNNARVTQTEFNKLYVPITEGSKILEVKILTGVNTLVLEVTSPNGTMLDDSIKFVRTVGEATGYTVEEGGLDSIENAHTATYTLKEVSQRTVCQLKNLSYTIEYGHVTGFPTTNWGKNHFRDTSNTMDAKALYNVYLNNFLVHGDTLPTVEEKQKWNSKEERWAGTIENIKSIKQANANYKSSKYGALQDALYDAQFFGTEITLEDESYDTHDPKGLKQRYSKLVKYTLPKGLGKIKLLRPLYDKLAQRKFAKDVGEITPIFCDNYESRALELNQKEEG